MDKTLIKAQLLIDCKAKLAKSIASVNNSLELSISSMHGETKSSAGDKFETSRAMLQAEQDRLKTILIKNKELQHQLNTLSIEPDTVVRLGSVVVTDRAQYFIAVSLGKIVSAATNYYCISPAAPISQLLIGTKEGDTILFNGSSMVIKSVY